MSTVSEFEDALSQYKSNIESAYNERLRAQYFIEFFRTDLNIAKELVGHPTELRPELEEHLKGEETQEERPNDRSLEEFVQGVEEPDDNGTVSEEEEQTVFLSGRLDARVGNLIMEFKDDINADRENAEEQLRKYVFLLHQEGHRDKDFLCFATDGELFIPYEARIDEPVESREDVTLSELPIGELDVLDADDPEHVRRWFTALIKERATPLVKNIDDYFGVGSDMFSQGVEIIAEAYQESEKATVHHEEWDKYFRYAQGSAPEASEQLFFRHTYLASFAKLLTYMVFVRGSMPSPGDAVDVLRGDVGEPFPENLFEEDLFSWIGATDQGLDLAEGLLESLLNFNLGEIDQDVFKHLYQEMVSPDVRHDLGEYYTPDWLAEYLLQKLDLAPQARVLDPGCGSGTFLVEVLQEKIEKSDRPPGKLVENLQNEVVGIDIHPLAVGVSKANYMATIKELLQHRRGSLQIPVYLADAMIYEEEWQEENEIEMTELVGATASGAQSSDNMITVRGPIEVSKESYYIPDKSIDYPDKLNQALDLVQKHLEDEEGFKGKFQRDLPDFSDIRPVFDLIRKDMGKAAREKRDSIHAFILKNFYRPFYLADNGSFDAIIGNPPWLVYNSMNQSQQNDTRELLQRYGLHPGPQNVSNIELATLFVARCSDLYLRDGGQIGFVMPRSIFTASQHDSLRRGELTVPLHFDRLLDLEDINPLFNVPTSAMIAHKGNKLEYPIPKETITGTLPEKDLGLEEAMEHLKIEEGEIFCHGNGTTSWDEVPPMKQSDYYSEIFKGAYIAPRPLWFCELQEQARGDLGFDPNRPPLINSEYAVNSTKREEYETRIKARVEKEFIYSTLIGSDMVPFTHKRFQRAVLPIVAESSNYSLIDSDQARTSGYTGLADWLKQAEEMYARTETRIETIYERIDYQGEITRQDPSIRYRVLTPSNGTNVVSCVVDTEKINDDSLLPSSGFITEHKTYHYETNSEDEAYYLMAVLNSNVINDSIKNLQSRGDFGPRDIHTLPYEFNIPRYDEDDSDHRRLLELGHQAEEKAKRALEEALEEYSHIGYIRRWVGDAVSEETEEIDEIVERVIGNKTA